MSSENWKILHERALEYKGKSDIMFLGKFRKTIPNFSEGGCKCKDFWISYMKKNPPTYGLDENSYFAWTVNLHNAVNEKLGKKIISLDEALSIWNKDI